MHLTTMGQQPDTADPEEYERRKEPQELVMDIKRAAFRRAHIERQNNDAGVASSHTKHLKHDEIVETISPACYVAQPPLPN